MAALYEALDRSGYSDHEASIFLIRTLFCFYGDDAGLWERDLFAEFLDTRTCEDGSDLGTQLAFLNRTLNNPWSVVSHSFRQGSHLHLRQPRNIQRPLCILSIFSVKLEESTCAFDWSGSSPAVIGALFQSAKPHEARRELDDHFQ